MALYHEKLVFIQSVLFQMYSVTALAIEEVRTCVVSVFEVRVEAWVVKSFILIVKL